MDKNSGILSNKYYGQVTNIIGLYRGLYKLYRKLADLEKKGLKDSEEYISCLDAVKAGLEVEKRRMSEFDNLDSVEMENLIYDICDLDNETEEDMIDKTRLYTTNSIKRLITRLRDYAFLRNDTYDLETTEDVEQDKTFEVPASNGMILQIKLSDIKKLGFTYDEPEIKERSQEASDLIKANNIAMYNKEKVINANFLKLLEEEIANTTNKKFKNELIDYKYNLIFNCVSLECAFAEGKNISKQVDAYKYIVEELADIYPEEYENVYSNVIVEDIRYRIKELTSKEYKDEMPNKEEAFEDKIDLLYIKSLINSVISEESRNDVLEISNSKKYEEKNPTFKSYLGVIGETIKELKLKQ